MAIENRELYGYERRHERINDEESRTDVRRDEDDVCRSGLESPRLNDQKLREESSIIISLEIRIRFVTRFRDPIYFDIITIEPLWSPPPSRYEYTLASNIHIHNTREVKYLNYRDRRARARLVGE